MKGHNSILFIYWSDSSKTCFDCKGYCVVIGAPKSPSKNVARAPNSYVQIPMLMILFSLYWVNSIFLPQHFTFLGEMLHNKLCRYNLNNYPQNLGTSVPTQATFRPRAHDEDLQRELAAMHRCDAICAISQEEEQLVQDYGIPSWKAPIEREKQMNSNSTWKKQQWHLVNFIHLLVWSIHWTLVWVRFFKPTQLDVVQIQGRLNTSSGALDLWIYQAF